MGVQVEAPAKGTLRVRQVASKTWNPCVFGALGITTISSQKTRTVERCGDPEWRGKRTIISVYWQ